MFVVVCYKHHDSYKDALNWKTEENSQSENEVQLKSYICNGEDVSESYLLTAVVKKTQH